MRHRFVAVLGLLIGLLVPTTATTPQAAAATPLQVYGAWHCGDDFCPGGACAASPSSTR